MIPQQYQKLHLWAKLEYRVIVNMQKHTPQGEIWNRAYFHGARFAMRQFIKQLAYEIKIARRDGYGRN